ncbi:MAG: hypothetical protein GX946_10035 [Oligosphaeraceae bacterium]|nr:hypothetical protein [Oligosphaeraceae bacterium]
MHILTNTYHVFNLPAEPGQDVELDMGCGKGSFTLQLAQRYPQRLVLGSDLMIGRLGSVRRKRDRLNLKNLVLLRASNLALASFQLPPNCIDRLHLLCPDPWPKRHHRIKRLVCTDFISRLQRILKPGAILHLSTDHEPYYEDWLKMLGYFPNLIEYPEGIADITDIKSDFERQWNARGMEVRHLCRKLIAE